MTSPGKIHPRDRFAPQWVRYRALAREVAAQEPIVQADFDELMQVGKAEPLSLTDGDIHSDIDRLRAYFAREEVGFANRREQWDYLQDHAIYHLLDRYDLPDELAGAHVNASALNPEVPPELYDAGYEGDKLKNAGPLRFRP